MRNSVTTSSKLSPNVGTDVTSAPGDFLARVDEYLSTLSPFIHQHGFHATQVEPAEIARQLGLTVRPCEHHWGKCWFGYQPPNLISYSRCSPDETKFALACGIACHLFQLPATEKLLDFHHSLSFEALTVLATKLLIVESSLHSQMLSHAFKEDLATLFQVPVRVMDLRLQLLGLYAENYHNPTLKP